MATINHVVLRAGVGISTASRIVSGNARWPLPHWIGPHPGLAGRPDIAKKIYSFAFLVGVLASGACSAHVGSTCQPACGEDKRECHALAQHAAKMEDRPLASMNAKIPKLAFTGSDGPLIENKGNQIRDFRERRQERSRTCDEKYMTCVRSCAKEVSEPDTGSVVLKPRADVTPAPRAIGE